MSVKWTRRSGEPAVATVDASAGPESVVLTRVPTGDTLVVRRVDASANAVTVSVASGLTLNGNPTGTVAVSAGGEAQLLSLDAGFVSFQTSGGGGGAVASVVGVTGAVTGAQIAADPALKATYAAISEPIGAAAQITANAATAFTPLFNFSSNSLLYARAALNACRRGTQDFRILVLGDSIPAGYFVSPSPEKNIFAAHLARIIATKAGLNYRRGLVGIQSFTPGSSSGTYDAQWTVGAGWSASGLKFGDNQGNSYTAAAGTAGVLTFTPTDDNGASVQADSFNVYAYTGGTAGDFQWSIDAGGFSTKTTSGTGKTGFIKFNVSAGSLGTHTLNIKQPAAGNQCYILGAEAVNSTAPGIRWAVRGINGENVPSSFTGTGDPTTAADYGADLVVGEWFINNYVNQIATATTQTNLQTMMAMPASWSKKPDVIWLVPTIDGTSRAIPQSSYITALDAASTATGVPVFHIDRVFGTYAAASASPVSAYGDTLHPNINGHGIISGALGNFLSNL